MTDALRYTLDVTFFDPNDGAAAECVHEIDVLVGKLSTLDVAGGCQFNYETTTSGPMIQARCVDFDTLHEFFKTKSSSPGAPVARFMQALFTLRGTEHGLRFHCKWHPVKVADGFCCNRVTNYKRNGGTEFKSLVAISVARSWLINRTDLLALTDERIDAMSIRDSVKANLKEFLIWLRQNPAA